jgi:hypothetical protein
LTRSLEDDPSSAGASAVRNESGDSVKASSSVLAPSGVSASCPLCGGDAQSSQGTGETHLLLLICGSCRVFVIEKQVVDIIANAREWNLRAVLRHIASLSLAAQTAAMQGAALLITSTNWIRLAVRQERAHRDSDLVGVEASGVQRLIVAQASHPYVTM